MKILKKARTRSLLCDYDYDASAKASRYVRFSLLLELERSKHCRH